MRLLPALLAAIIAQGGFGTSPFAARGDEKIQDKDITRAIETSLRHDPIIPARLVDVDTREGTVTLSGSADTASAKARAAEIAEGTKGVREVENRIKVRPTARSDEEVREDVRVTLAQDPATCGAEVGVTVADGVATLTGSAGTWPLKDLIAQVVRDIKGVREVRDEIRVAGQAERPDNEIASDMVDRIRSDAWLHGARIDASVRDGRVSLRGTVGSAAGRTRAIRDVQHVAGVKDVDARGVEVRWLNWYRDTHPEGKSIARTDEDVRGGVERALRSDPRSGSFRPEVEVEDGVVTLSGVVDNLAAKWAADRTARGIAGVWRVREYLRVHPKNALADDQVAKDLAAALARDAYLERSGIRVTVSHGQAILDGTVSSPAERARAEDIASRVNGVTEVADRLQLASMPPSTHGWRARSDWEIQKDIESELYWSPFVNSEHVKVSVEDGVVTVTGTVDTWLEHGAVIENAYEGGAQSVRDRLKVRAGPAYYRP